MDTITIGGNRLGSGRKMQTAIKENERHNANLSYNFASSMTCGVLYPFMVMPITRGENFKINLEAAARTIPTKGPLFGSYKLQIDVFECPIRLYQALLHNNPTALGMKMSDVVFPQLRVKTKYERFVEGDNRKLKGQFSNSSLQKYLGMSGIGLGNRRGAEVQTIQRDYLAIPTLAYYDIFKNYYSNKQEAKGYGITGYQTEETYSTDEVKVKYLNTNEEYVDGDTIHLAYSENVFETNVAPTALRIELGFAVERDGIWNIINTENNDQRLQTLEQLHENGYLASYKENQGTIKFSILTTAERNAINLKAILNAGQKTYKADYIHIEEFPLSNIDDMRMAILSHHAFGVPFIIDENANLPYEWNTRVLDNGYSANTMPLNGLVLKTYQNDIFNNWLDTEWIDGENGIAEITKIATQDGAFKLDALNLAEKLYNMLNRVAVAGATYEDWQDVVYTSSPKKHTESPVYLGGASYEVVFEEIIQSAPAEGEPLGTLGGRGTLVKRKGGDVVVTASEAAFIIGIASLTPRVYYTQGNEWYNTELKTMDDLHKPALDGIGYENLIGERMAWFDTEQDANGKLVRHTIGKLPAWINYNTNFDKAYGDFAELDGKGFMILNRNYEFDGNNDRVSFIKDPTTYIDPTKYNYAFAYTELEAQNFWVQIHSEITARRMGSGKQIPNL